MIVQIGYLALVAKQHASQIPDYNVAASTGLPLPGIWRAYAWGISWRRWFFGLILHQRLANIWEEDTNHV